MEPSLIRWALLEFDSVFQPVPASEHLQVESHLCDLHLGWIRSRSHCLSNSLLILQFDERRMDLLDHSVQWIWVVPYDFGGHPREPVRILACNAPGWKCNLVPGETTGSILVAGSPDIRLGSTGKQRYLAKCRAPFVEASYHCLDRVDSLALRDIFRFDPSAIRNRFGASVTTLELTGADPIRTVLHPERRIRFSR